MKLTHLEETNCPHCNCEPEVVAKDYYGYGEYISYSCGRSVHYDKEKGKVVEGLMCRQSEEYRTAVEQRSATIDRITAYVKKQDFGDDGAAARKILDALHWASKDSFIHTPEKE